MHLQTAWPQDGLIDLVLTVCHADEKDVVEGTDSIDLAQELVDNRVIYPC